MKKIIIGAVVGVIILVVTFSYFIITNDKPINDLDNIEKPTKEIISTETENPETKITEEPDRILKVDNNELKKKCKITKCTSQGCFCI